jgi:hypothetical protein
MVADLYSTLQAGITQRSAIPDAGYRNLGGGFKHFV